jgi:hypothetical protein
MQDLFFLNRKPSGNSALNAWKMDAGLEVVLIPLKFMLDIECYCDGENTIIIEVSNIIYSILRSNINIRFVCELIYVTVNNISAEGDNFQNPCSQVGT